MLARTRVAPVTKGDPTIQVQFEGRIIEIGLTAGQASEIKWLNQEDPTTPVQLIFTGRQGFFICIYDHRTAVRDAMKLTEGDLSDWQPLFDAFQEAVPCVGGFRRKRGAQYIVLADLGTPDIADGGEKERFVLTYGQNYNHETHKLPSKLGRMIPLHPDTGIRLVVPI